MDRFVVRKGDTENTACVSFGDHNTRIPFVCNALKIWEVRNFPLDFLGQVRNIPHAEFSPAEKTQYRNSPPPPVHVGYTLHMS